MHTLSLQFHTLLAFGKDVIYHCSLCGGTFVISLFISLYFAVSYQISSIWGWTALMVALPGKKETGASMPYPMGCEVCHSELLLPVGTPAPPAASCHPVSPSAILLLPLTFQGFKSIHFHFLSSFTCTVQATSVLFSCCRRSSTSFTQVSRLVRNIGGQKSKPKSFARHL